MKAFFVGLLVIFMVALISFAGVLIFPLLLVLGFFLRWVLGLFLILFSIWLVGKVTLFLIQQIKKK